MRERRFHLNLFAAGMIALFLGGLVYLMDRQPDRTYFIDVFAHGLSFYGQKPAVFGKIGYYLPSFLHVFSFSLMTAAFYAYSIKNAFCICFSWLSINCLFELGQFHGHHLPDLIPDFHHIYFMENIRGYFQNGSFCLGDIFYSICGALVAFAAITLNGKIQLGGKNACSFKQFK